MFGLKRKEKEGSSIVLVPPKKPVALIPQVGVIPLGAYENLADKLGFMPAQLLEEQLKRFLVEHSIPVYNYAEVDKYLMYKAEQENKHWIWRPFREQDKPKGWHWDGHFADGSREQAWRAYGSYRDEWEYRPYEKAVPIHILRRVEKIQDRFKDNVLFFVSDYAVPNPDPFIMVTALDVSKIIFGVWDEPAFDTESATE